MKLKILAIGVIIMMLSCSLLSKAETKNNSIITNEDIKEIRVAIYSMNEDTYGSDVQAHFDIFDGYQWKVGNKIYRFTINTIDDEDIRKGELNTKNYDVFRISYMEAMQLMMRLSHPRIKNMIWKKKVTDFIKQGGGYFGSCASSMIATTGLENKPTTLVERFLNKGTLSISQLKVHQTGGFPFLSQITGHPEKIGPPAYVWFSGWDENNASAWISGACLDIPVDKNNPIFKDICGDTRRIMWCGGPYFVMPENSNAKVIAYYPSEEISDNKSTQLHAWKYIGGLKGILSGFLRSMKMGNIFNKLYFTPFKATDWEMTDTIIQTNRANQPFMTLETYPNENQGRIVLCGGHPEDTVWWGGHIQESIDTSKNELFDSLYHWADITKIDYTYNWCIFRREAAWAAKIPDNDLPPIYGASQVSDICPYNQTSSFTIYGNAEISEGVESLDLYYRYSTDDSSWSDWTLYDTGIDGSNGWIWDFNALNGNGYYQFYSIRHVEYDDHTETETAPPGPDAVVHII